MDFDFVTLIFMAQIFLCFILYAIICFVKFDLWEPPTWVVRLVAVMIVVITFIGGIIEDY